MGASVLLDIMNGRCGAQDIFHDHKLIASRIDFFADALPHKIVASVPISASDASQGYRNVTVKAFARAIDRAARWMDNALSQCATVDSAVEIFAYDGPVDLRWLILLVAAIKTSRTVSTCSPHHVLPESYFPLDSPLAHVYVY